MNVAAVLSRLDRNDEARNELAAAARLRPFSAEPHVYLALVNANSNHVAEAIQNVERALALDEAEANVRFTNAVRMPYKDTNLREYLMFLRQQEPAR
jgi:tetratricopeptide (TPR) repeat protein